MNPNTRALINLALTPAKALAATLALYLAWSAVLSVAGWVA